MEFDTHADTMVLSKNYLIIQDFNQTVAVSGWYTSKAKGAIDCPTVTGVTSHNKLTKTIQDKKNSRKPITHNNFEVCVGGSPDPVVLVQCVNVSACRQPLPQARQTGVEE